MVSFLNFILSICKRCFFDFSRLFFFFKEIDNDIEVVENNQPKNPNRIAIDSKKLSFLKSKEIVDLVDAESDSEEQKRTEQTKNQKQDSKQHLENEMVVYSDEDIPHITSTILAQDEPSVIYSSEEELPNKINSWSSKKNLSDTKATFHSDIQPTTKTTLPTSNSNLNQMDTIDSKSPTSDGKGTNGKQQNNKSETTKELKPNPTSVTNVDVTSVKPNNNTNKTDPRKESTSKKTQVTKIQTFFFFKKSEFRKKKKETLDYELALKLQTEEEHDWELTLKKSEQKAESKPTNSKKRRKLTRRKATNSELVLSDESPVKGKNGVQIKSNKVSNNFAFLVCSAYAFATNLKRKWNGRSC